MRRLSPLFAVAALLLVNAARGDEPAPAQPAAAAPSEPDVAEKKQRAAALFAEGNRLLGEAAYPEALEQFRAAYAHYKSPKVLLNIGTTLRQLGRNVEAAVSYEAYLQAPDASPERKIEVRRVLTEIDSLVGRVHVVVDPKDAEVRVDGEQVVAEAGVVRVRAEPGSHQITAQKKGFSSAVQAITVAPREERSLTIRLTAPDRRPVIVVDNPENPLRTVGWAFTIVAALDAAAGGVTGGLALSHAQDARAHCYRQTNRCDAQGTSLSSAANFFATTSTITFVTSGVALAAGVFLLVASPPQKNPTSGGISNVRAAALLGPGTAGLSLEAAW